MKYMHFLLCGITVAATIGFRVYYQASAYSDGLDNAPWAPELLTLLIVALVGITSLVVLVLWVGYLLIVREGSGGKIACQAIVMTAIIVGVGYVSFSSMQRPTHYFLMGFRDFLDSHANLPEIRRWFHSGDFEQGDIPHAKWPTEIAELSPSRVFVRVEGVTVVLSWSGGYFDWGVVLRGGDAERFGYPPRDWSTYQLVDERTYVFTSSR